MLLPKNKSNSSYSCPNILSVSTTDKNFITLVKFSCVKQLNVLIDTGADISCIRSNEARSLVLNPYRKEEIRGANGTRA